MTETTWAGCYDDQWRGLITDESFAHPAKIARGLVRRIYAHALGCGYLKPGDVVVDPFGGIGGTALDAMTHGLHWRGCELEPRFVALCEANLADWRRYHQGTAVIVQGDSRNLVAVLQTSAAGIVTSPPFLHARSETTHSKPTRGGGPCAERNHTANGDLAGGADAVVSSPPFMFMENNVNIGGDTPGMRQQITNGQKREQSYGVAPGQLGNLPPGDVAAVISSPPYSETNVARNSNGVDLAKQFETYKASGGGSSFEKFAAVQQKHSGDYGSTPGQLSALPPGTLADGIVSSPPYEGSFNGGEKVEPEALEADMRRRGCSEEAINKAVGNGHTGGLGYGVSNGQLGNDTGSTFWEAAAQIVRQCFAILRPGGVCYWVVKSFVRQKQLVDFPGQWQSLGEACGFETVEVIHASLVKTWEENTLFDGKVQKEKKRASFFRRLAEKKGSPRIDHEDVLVMRKVSA